MAGNTKQVYDRIARRSQLLVQFLVFVTIGSAVGVSMVSAVSGLEPNLTQTNVFFDIVITLFLLGIGAQLARQIGHFEDKWFQGRAVAETAKSLGWQYSMGTWAVQLGSSADQNLIDLLNSTMKEYSRSMKPKVHPSISNEISPEMKRLRDLDWKIRRDEYISGRIKNQIAWYSKKADSNARLSKIYGVAATSTQVLGIGVTACAYYTGAIGFKGVIALIATLITAIVGWAQSRRYAELVEPYLYTGQALSEIWEEIKKAPDEPSFKLLVWQCERAISREHQMWQLRRGLATQTHLRGESHS